jgi:hypothetical protein
MPKEADQERLKLLRRLFASTASDVPEFTETAVYGGYRLDEGVVALVPGEGNAYEKTRRLKQAVVDFLDGGGRPNRLEAPGDAEMQLDAATFYEFRIEIEAARLFVKAVLDEDDPADPELKVLSVKCDDRAWK